MASDKVKQQFEALQNALKAAPEVAENAAVKTAMSDMKKALDKPDDPSASIGMIFGSLASAVGSFTKPDSNSADIMSGILEVASAVVNVVGLLAGTNPITGPLALALKVVGSIFGAFGVSKASRYYKILNAMVVGAVQALNSELVEEALSGALYQMYADRQLLATIQSKPYAKPGQLLELYPDFTVKSFVDIAAKEIGSAYRNLASNIGQDHKDNWKQAAETFYTLSEVVAFKIAYMLDGITFFNLAEADAAKVDGVARADALTNALIDFKNGSYDYSKLYFERPSLRAAAITHWIYRMPAEKFRLIANLNTQLSLDTKTSTKDALKFSAVYFDYDPYHDATPDNQRHNFQCSVPTKHDSQLKSCHCVRLVTQYRRGKDKNTYCLSIAANPFTTTLSSIQTSGDPNWFSKLDQTQFIAFLKDKDLSKKMEWSHFALDIVKDDGTYAGTADTRPPPHQQLALTARTWMQIYGLSGVAPQPIGTGRPTFNGLYAFYVYPTAAEWQQKSSESGWPHNRLGDPLRDEQPLMIGMQGGDKILCDNDNDHRFAIKSLYDVYYDKSHGHPEHAIWYFLQQNEF